MQRVNASVQDEQGWLGAVAECLDEIEDLPSAQPEVIRCKDCKWKNNHNCTRAVEVWIDDNKYCAWAERREDGNG